MALLFWLRLGAAGNHDTLERPPDALIAERLRALASLETGCRSEQACRADHRVGRSGEVSRYQILLKVWRQHRGLAARTATAARVSWQDPAVARAVAERIACARVAVFMRARGRAPDDLEWYALWNAPGRLARAGFVAEKLPAIVRGRALRFQALMPGSK